MIPLEPRDRTDSPGGTKQTRSLVSRKSAVFRACSQEEGLQLEVLFVVRRISLELLQTSSHRWQVVHTS